MDYNEHSTLQSKVASAAAFNHLVFPKEQLMDYFVVIRFFLFSFFSDKHVSVSVATLKMAWNFVFCIRLQFS